MSEPDPTAPGAALPAGGAASAIAPAIAEERREHAPPPWLFALLVIPYGVGGSFSSATLGRILELHHAPRGKITAGVFLSILMAGIAFLYAPTVDIRLRRRTWFLIFAATSAVLLALALRMLPAHLDAFIALILASQASICLANACIGGLMATVIPDRLRGRTAGFFNFGNLGFGAIAGGLTLQLIEVPTRILPLLGEVDAFRLTGLVAAALIFLPALLVLAIHEPVRPRRGGREIFSTMLRDVWGTLRRREGWSGVLLCLSPVGTAAAMQVFSSFASSYGASGRVVTWVNGYAGGLLTGVACLCGGWLCDRVDRRLAYLVSGGFTAVIAFALAVLPMNQTTYAVGGLTYLFAAGFCYASFTAFVLEVIGSAGASASTQYTLFSSAGNLAITWVGFVEGVVFERWGAWRGEAQAPRGLFFGDGALNVIGIVAFLGLLRILRPARRALP